MPQHSDDRGLLTRYFLGVASADEREAVEEKYLAVDSSLEAFLRAEDEVIDDYVRGVLNTSERVLFEENFLCSATRRQRLEFTRSLVEALERRQEEARAFFVSLQGQPALAYRPELFGSLLAWLDPVRERAAKKYEIIRSRLIRMFASRGSVDAEELADQTIDRVSRSLAEVKEKYSGDPTTYFYGVANHVLQESLRAHAPDSMPLEAVIQNVQTGSVDEERAHSCLQKCLAQLSDSNRELILQFYSLEKNDKTGNRKRLALRLGISLNALRVRVHRVRSSLQKCVTSCLQESE